MKPSLTYHPFYPLKGNRIKELFEVKDDRTVRNILDKAGIKVRLFGGMEVVFTEDLTDFQQPGDYYESKSKFSKDI